MKRVTIGLVVVSLLCLVSTSYGGIRIADFEGGFDGWASAAGSVTLSNSTIGATHGTQSLKLTNTTSGWQSTAAKASIAQYFDAWMDPANTTLELDLTFVGSELANAGGWVELWIVSNSQNGGWRQARPSTDDVSPNATGGWTHGTGTETHHVTWDLNALGWKGGFGAGAGGWFELFFITNSDGSKAYTTNFYIDNITIGKVAADFGALTPKPADKATDVRRDSMLTWAPGRSAKTHDVYFGTSFNDVNNASRTSPLGVLVGQNQDANSFDPPGLLALGQTYYWRIDEVNAPPDSTVHKGTVWSFTSEPALYVIGSPPGGGTITATASSTATTASAQNTANGVGLTGDLHSNLNADMWLSAPGAAQPAWIQYAFDRLYKLDSMWVWNYNAQFEDLIGFGIKQALVQYSVDGTNWTTLDTFTFAQASGTSGYAHDSVVNFKGAAAKYVKITAVSNWGGKAQSGLSEVRFFHLIEWAREPSPASGTTGLATNVTLGWRAGRDAASGDVYLGTDPNALSKDGTTASNSYNPSSLNLGTKYYWRVDEVNTAASPTTWTGDVWNFTTGEYVTVDDMESYNDTTNKMFDVWVDGYGTTTNGSQVGYIDSGTTGTFGSTTIVHSGKQSMPFNYSNKTAAYSEATRTFSSLQDWTSGGADTLSLYVEGVPTNFVQNNGVILMNGTGADIWGTADQFHFVYKKLSGDGSIIAKVESLDVTDVWSKAGVMIRATLDAGSMNAANFVSGSSGVSFQNRIANGGASLNVGVTGLAAPYWVKVTRNGTSFTAQRSPDGVTWTDMVASPLVTMTMPTDVYIGLAVTSHNASLVAGARFSNISTTGTVTGNWTSADVGVTNPAGNGLDTFYLAVQDNAGHSKTVTADPYIVVAGAWQQWKIPLSTFSSAGVKLNSVKKITLGVGDKTKAASGATGILYIDDIAFGHPAQ